MSKRSSRYIERARRYVDAFVELDLIAHGTGKMLLAYRRHSRALRCPPQFIVVAALHNHIAYLRQFVDRKSAEHFFAAEPHLAAFVLAHAAKNAHMGVLRALYAAYEGPVPVAALDQAKRRNLTRVAAFLATLPGEVCSIDVDDAPAAETPHPPGGDIVLSVLTDASLMAAIGAFQPSPEVDTGLVLSVYRLEALFCMRRGDGWRPNPASMFAKSFPSSKVRVDSKNYLPAADARRQLLALLRGRGSADTDADWTNLIEWLEVHRPANAHAVPDRDLAEIALAGDLNVLKACRAFEIGQFSPLVMDMAMMDANNSTATVDWLLEMDAACASEHALAFALTGWSWRHMRRDLARRLLASPRLDPSVQEQAVRIAMLRACRSDEVEVWEELRELVTQIQIKIGNLQPSVEDAHTDAARQAAPSDVVERLRYHHGRGEVGPRVFPRALQVAREPANDAFIAFLLDTLKTRETLDRTAAPSRYFQLLEVSAEVGNTTALRNLLELETARGGICSPDQMGQLLRLADSNASIAKIVLENGGHQLTKAILLAHVPQCLVVQLIRYLAANDAVRRLSPHEPVAFASILDQRSARLTWHEIDAVISLEDPELSGLLWSRARGCLSYWVVSEAIQAGAALRFLQRLQMELACEIPAMAMDVACQSGRLDVVQWLVVQCGMQNLSAPQLQQAIGRGHMHILDYASGLEGHRTALASVVRGALDDAGQTPRELAVRLLDFAAQLRPPILDGETLLRMALQWGYADGARSPVQCMDQAGDTTLVMVNAAKRDDFGMVDAILTHSQLDTGLMTIRSLYGFDMTGNMTKLIDRLATRVPAIRAELDRERAWLGGLSTADAIDWGLSSPARTKKQQAAAHRTARVRRLGKLRCHHRGATRTRLSESTAATAAVSEPSAPRPDVYQGVTC